MDDELVGGKEVNVPEFMISQQYGFRRPRTDAAMCTRNQVHFPSPVIPPPFPYHLSQTLAHLNDHGYSGAPVDQAHSRAVQAPPSSGGAVRARRLQGGVQRAQGGFVCDVNANPCSHTRALARCVLYHPVQQSESGSCAKATYCGSPRCHI